MCSTSGAPMLAIVFPYPYVRADAYRATLCSREDAMVRKRPECWTCSWCVRGSDTMVSDAVYARECKLGARNGKAIPMRVTKGDGGNGQIIPRAA